MGQCKKDLTPLLTHWSFIFPALTHPNSNAQCLWLCVLCASVLGVIQESKTAWFTKAKGVNSQPGAYFTNDFFPMIQIWWKFHSAFTQTVVKWLLWNFAYGMTAVLSWHVQNFIAIYLSVEFRYTKTNFPLIRITMEKSFVKWGSILEFTGTHFMPGENLPIIGCSFFCPL